MLLAMFVVLFQCYVVSVIFFDYYNEQGAALIGRKTTGPPCSCGAITRLEEA